MARDVIYMAKIYQHSGPHLFLLLWKASHTVNSYSQKSINAAGLGSLSDFAVLELLLHKGAQPVNIIGEKILLTSGSITTAVQRLEKQGLVSRERSSVDKRVVLVHLTDEGRALIEPSFEAHAKDLNELFDVLNESERTQFADLMRKVGQRAEQL